ncbi:MAG: hypothetical protein JSR80_04235 [Verrucomicrobia bacterium]|nr:hypothetical protein [Verrucomicrobiota bacterium]
METQKTTARSVLLPLAFGTFSFALTSVIANKIFNSPLQKALMYGGSVGFPATLVTWGFIGRNKIDPSKLQIPEEKKKTEQILQALEKVHISRENVAALVEARNWSALSIAIWAHHYSPSQELPKEEVLSLDSGLTFTFYDQPPIDKIFFTEEEFLNFTSVHVKRFAEIYTQVTVNDQTRWIAKSALSLNELKQDEQLKTLINSGVESSSSLQIRVDCVVKAFEKHVKAQNILQNLSKAGISSPTVTSLVKERDWKALSKEIWAKLTCSTEQEPPPRIFSLKNGQTLTVHEKLPIDVVVFTEEELLNFNTEHCKRLEQLYTEVEVEGKLLWIAKSDTTLWNTFQQEQKKAPTTFPSTVSEVEKNHVLKLNTLELPLFAKSPNNKGFVSLEISENRKSTTYWISTDNAWKLVEAVAKKSNLKKYDGASSIKLNTKTKTIEILMNYKKSRPQELTFDCKNCEVTAPN